MSIVSKEEAQSRLAFIGMHLGEWNQIALNATVSCEESYWLKHQAPRDASQLLSLSQHIAGWLAEGAWKILQIDNSNSLDLMQDLAIGRLVFGPDHRTGIGEDKTILFEFGGREEEDRNTELLIVDLIFAFLLFEGHCYLASSGGARMSLGLQDGFVYFAGPKKAITSAQEVIDNFSCAPMTAPKWVLRFSDANKEPQT